MKIGLTSYSLHSDIKNGRKTILDAMRFASENGAEHMEIVPLCFSLYDDATGTFNDALMEEIRALSAELALPLSNYDVSADLLSEDQDVRRAEVERVKRNVDVACRLGIPTMRHDLASSGSPSGENSARAFEHFLPFAVESAREIADYAGERGVTTLLENHGRFVNGSDRVLRVIDAVDRPNYGLLLDTGNFRCVDEDPLVAVKACASQAKMVHLKDFYVRKNDQLRGVEKFGSWFSSASGEYRLRGSILAQGDLDVWNSLRMIRDAGYDGYVSIEFEGMENCECGCIAGMNAARWILENL